MCYHAAMTNYDYMKGDLRFGACDLVLSHPKVVRYALELIQHRLIGTLLDCGICPDSAEVAQEWWHAAQLLGGANELPRDASAGWQECLAGSGWAVMFEASAIRAWILRGSAAVLDVAREEWDYLRLQIEDEVWDRTKIGLGIPFDRMIRLAFLCWFAVQMRELEGERLPVDGGAAE